jgi:hypothetical protein
LVTRRTFRLLIGVWRDPSSFACRYCPKCRKHQIATKTLTLWRLPPLMVVHLKRFSYTRVHRHKIDVDVDYPLAGLDLAPYMQLSDAAHGHAGSYTYDLFAVVEHHGALGGGHYTAHALNDLPAPAPGPAHQVSNVASEARRVCGRSTSAVHE